MKNMLQKKKWKNVTHRNHRIDDIVKFVHTIVFFMVASIGAIITAIFLRMGQFVLLLSPGVCTL